MLQNKIEDDKNQKPQLKLGHVLHEVIASVLRETQRRRRRREHVTRRQLQRSLLIGQRTGSGGGQQLELLLGLPLPPEVAVVEHLLAVGVNRPVVTFARVIVGSRHLVGKEGNLDFWFHGRGVGSW